ncbi:MAG TPA: L-threonylcarbamoyladenylate synthase [Chitinophagaceae bacterium]|nr:L-threonylcarbamoyladenylate synthase [Chitinophagaceae bacterium]
MNNAFFENEVAAALNCLRMGGVLLYPTDTVWGLGCNATNKEAIDRIYTIKKRSDEKSLIMLVAEERDIFNYVAAVDLELFDFLSAQEKPTTTIFDGALNLPQNLIKEDGTIAIRIVKDEFCRHLIKRLQQPLISTSANISGAPSPSDFSSIEQRIKESVDHIVQYRQNERINATPSQIIRWKKDGTVEYIRK